MKKPTKKNTDFWWWGGWGPLTLCHKSGVFQQTNQPRKDSASPDSFQPPTLPLVPQQAPWEYVASSAPATKAPKYFQGTHHGMRLLIYQGFAKWTSFLVYHKTFFRSIGKVVFFFGKSWILSIAISGRISMRRLLTTFRTIYPFKNQKNQTLPQYSCKTDFPNDSRLLPWKSYFSGMKSMAFSFRRVWRFETPHHRLSPGCLSRSGINSVGAQEFSSTTLQPRYSHVLTHGFPRKFKNSGVENPKFMDILGQFKKLFFCELRAISPKQCVEKDH